MGHTVNLIFTNQRTTMKTVNTIVLKEEIDRKKATKLSMTRQEKVDYVNNWKKENDTFLCEAFGLEDGPQFQFLMGIFILPSTSKELVLFLQEVLQADATHMSFGKYTLYSVYGTNAMELCQHQDLPCCLAMRISKVGCNLGTSLRRHTQMSTSPIIQSSPTRTRVLYWQWKILSLWQEGSFVASIANRTLSRNTVTERVKEHCPLCGCTIS